MNEGNPRRTVSSPFRAPQAVPTASARSAAGASPRPSLTRPIPRAALLKAITEPTDKSMAPIRSTKVRPTEAITSSGTWFAMVRRVGAVKKRSVTREKPSTRAASTSSKASASLPMPGGPSARVMRSVASGPRRREPRPPPP